MVPSKIILGKLIAYVEVYSGKNKILLCKPTNIFSKIIEIDPSIKNPIIIPKILL